MHELFFLPLHYHYLCARADINSTPARKLISKFDRDATKDISAELAKIVERQAELERMRVYVEAKIREYGECAS